MKMKEMMKMAISFCFILFDLVGSSIIMFIIPNQKYYQKKHFNDYLAIYSFDLTKTNIKLIDEKNITCFNIPNQLNNIITNFNNNSIIINELEKQLKNYLRINKAILVFYLLVFFISSFLIIILVFSIYYREFYFYFNFNFILISIGIKILFSIINGFMIIITFIKVEEIRKKIDIIGFTNELKNGIIDSVIYAIINISLYLGEIIFIFIQKQKLELYFGLKNKIENLEKNIMSKNEKNKIIKNKINIVGESNYPLNNEIHHNDSLITKIEEINQIKKKQKNQKNIDELKQIINQNNIKINELNKEMQAKDEKIKDLIQTLNKKDEEIDQLKIRQNKKEIIDESNTLNIQINQLKEELKNKNKEINILQKKSDLKENEKLLTIIFTSVDQKLHYSLIGKNTDRFVNVEQNLYDIFPEYKETENYFLLNGNKINKNKTLDENNIKFSDVIVINEFE